MNNVTVICMSKFTKDGELFFLRKDTNLVIGKIDIEISDDEDESETGMMYRKDLGQDQGMLFILKGYRRRSFWMKNTLVTLDIIFSDYSKQINKIFTDTKPLSEELLPSVKPVKYTIEVKAGFCLRNGILEGDAFNYVRL